MELSFNFGSLIVFAYLQEAVFVTDIFRICARVDQVTHVFSLELRFLTRSPPTTIVS